MSTFQIIIDEQDRGVIFCSENSWIATDMNDQHLVMPLVKRVVLLE